MAGRRVIYIKNPSSGSHFRVLGGGGGNGPPIIRPPTGGGGTGSGGGTTGGGTTGDDLPPYDPTGGVIGGSTILIGATVGGPVGAFLIGSGLLAGYTLPMLPGWGQPLSFFSVLNTQNGATQGYQGNLLAAWMQIMEGLGTPTEGTIFDDFSLIKTKFGNSNAAQSSQSYYSDVAKRAGIRNPPPTNYGSGGDAIRRAIYDIGQSFATKRKKNK